jgi:hypothetical protein
LSATSGVQIESVGLEFGTDALACGQGVTRAVPEEFSAGTSVEVEWIWNLRRTGPLPPGTNIWWRWVLSDASGEVLVTPKQNLHFTDEAHRWRSLDSDSLILFWYEGTTDFAQALVDAGEESLERMRQVTGAEVERRIQVYIYASSGEMQAATLFAPDWSGGLAFPSHSTVLVGIPTTSLDWGKRVLRHELAHVMVGHYTFSCVDSTPIWLDEGLAMYAEGDLRPSDAELLSEAIEQDTLLSVRELGEIFSNDPELASLSYAQSLSLVEFLIDRYGQEQMLQLLGEFREGMPEDEALMAVYGMDRDGLEAAWREWVGAAPMQSGEPSGTTPTPFPTLAPITGPVVAPSEAPQTTDQPAAPAPPDAEATVVSPERREVPRPFKAALALAIGAGCLLLPLVAVGGWYFWRRRKES